MVALLDPSTHGNSPACDKCRQVCVEKEVDKHGEGQAGEKEACYKTAQHAACPSPPIRTPAAPPVPHTHTHAFCRTI
jgi:hypothetical protein